MKVRQVRYILLLMKDTLLFKKIPIFVNYTENYWDVQVCSSVQSGCASL